MEAVLASVDLTTVSAWVVTVSLIIVGIAMAFKSPDLAKRAIRKA